MIVPLLLFPFEKFEDLLLGPLVIRLQLISVPTTFKLFHSIGELLSTQTALSQMLIYLLFFLFKIHLIFVMKRLGQWQELGHHIIELLRSPRKDLSRPLPILLLLFRRVNIHLIFVQERLEVTSEMVQLARDFVYLRIDAFVLRGLVRIEIFAIEASLLDIFGRRILQLGVDFLNLLHFGLEILDGEDFVLGGLCLVLFIILFIFCHILLHLLFFDRL